MRDSPFLLYERKAKSRTRYGQHARNFAANGFICGQCHSFITFESELSGVQNRNHCPYCLWSRHLDLYVAGDRLSACKALMKPIGLTIKLTFKKYGPKLGELMLIHVCKECANLSINRIAADDNSQIILAVFESSLQMERITQDRLESAGIRRLGNKDDQLVRLQLFGNPTSLAEKLFQNSLNETM